MWYDENDDNVIIIDHDNAIIRWDHTDHEQGRQ